MEQVNFPERSQGAWKIDHFTVTGREFQGFSSRTVPPGTYTRLTRNGTLVMSDTPDEMEDHLPIVNQATGRVLINGLGLGMVLKNILLKPGVFDVTVIEIDQDLIDLVGPRLGWPNSVSDHRVSIVCADALTYKPPKGVRYNAVWHDIWDTICTDNLDQMKYLHRKYGRRTDWQGSWCRGLCEHQLKKEQKMFGGWY